jgi:hypothetical protein
MVGVLGRLTSPGGVLSTKEDNAAVLDMIDMCVRVSGGLDNEFAKLCCCSKVQL